MIRLTYLGPSPEMHAGGLAWKQGESHDFDDRHAARRMVETYKYAEWKLEEVDSEPKPEPSRRRGRRKAEPEPEPAPEAEEAPSQLTAYPTEESEETD